MYVHMTFPACLISKFILESKPTPLLLNEVVAKSAFLPRVRPPTYAVVHALLLSKKHQRSSTV